MKLPPERLDEVDYMMHFLRRSETEQTSHGLGLGWLLAIALCGGVLLFTTIGLLLVWWVKKKNQLGPQTVYGYSNSSSLMPPLSMRLTKRKLGGTESASGLSSRFSSRFSLSAAPVLPPLPSYNSFGGLFGSNNGPVRGRKRSRSWVDEDDLHGPKMGRSAKESWFSRDSWFGRVPTLPNLGVAEKGEMRSGDDRALNASHMSQALKPPRSSNEAPRGTARGGMVQVPQPVHVRPSATDSDLKVILHSTDRRLRDGHQRPPVKTPRSSPTKGSPTKTPRSYRTVSSQGSVGGWRMSQSPSKRVGLHAGTPRTASRHASVSSIGSAANSLIAAATQELMNTSPEREQQRSPLRPMQSPQRQSPQRQNPHMPMPQMQFPQMQYPQFQFPLLQFPEMQNFQRQSPQRQNPQRQNPQRQSPQRSPERRMSYDSDESSSLSTLYSVNEPEEKKPEARTAEDDPFVERGFPRRRPSWQTRQRPSNFDSLRRTKTLTSASLTRYVIDESAMPSPLRPVSVVSQSGMGRESLVSPISELAPLERPATEQLEDIEPKLHELLKTPSLSEAPSDASFVSVSVESDSDVTEVPARDTPKAEWYDASSSLSTPMVRVNGSELSLSPYDEQEILSILLASTEPGRALPLPPTSLTGPDGNAITAPSPRPRSLTDGPTRSRSTSSSVYTVESTVEPSSRLTGSPSRRSTVRSVTDGLAVGSTISQLRRMNSMVSSYSVASSMTSTVVAEGDSPPIHGTLSGGLIKPRSMILNPSGTISNRNYLNMGRLTAHKKNNNQQRGARSRQGHPGGFLSPDTRGYGKENQGLGLRMSRIADDQSSAVLREGQRRANVGRDPAMEVTRTVAWRPPVIKQRLGPVEELVPEERRRNHQRESVETLGLYDKDGFLLGSPEREARKRGLRI